MTNKMILAVERTGALDIHLNKPAIILFITIPSIMFLWLSRRFNHLITCKMHRRIADP